MAESDISFRVLDLNLLRVLDAMMAEGSVAGAASRLSVTPSAVSHALSRLRALFKDPLFVRSTGGMRATPRGSTLCVQVREGLQHLEGALTPPPFDAAESTRPFTLACSAYVSAVLLPGVIAQLRLHAPKAGIQILPWGPGVPQRFEAGQIDVLLGDFTRVPEGYESRTLFSDRLVWLMGRDYILTPGMADRRAALEAMKFSLAAPSVLENGLERRVAFDECCGITGNPIDAASGDPLLDSLPYSLIAPLVVKQAELAALLPRRLAGIFAQDLRLDIVEPAAEDEAAAAFRIAAIRHPDHGRRAPVAWFFDLLIEAASTLDDGPGQEDSGKDFGEEKKFTGEQPHALPR